MKLNKFAPVFAAISENDTAAAIAGIESAMVGETGKDWNKYMGWLVDFLRDGQPRFSIFAENGNGKLPFLSFSALPGVGFCPGAGECLKFCYSFLGHRYPATLGRQIQNSWLMKNNRQAILSALDKFEGMPRNAEGLVDFRLYVDGDFGSLDELKFWMDVHHDRPWLGGYGYSKSLVEFAEYEAAGYAWPENYTLNVSGGHKHGGDLVEHVKEMDPVRGVFDAILMGYKVTANMHGNREHQKNLRAAAGDRKVFTCPGKCGNCTPKGHACGSKRFAGVDIIIAVH